MKKTRRILLGTVLSVSLALSGCSSSQRDEEEEQYSTGSHSGVLYNHIGVPYLLGAGNSVAPMPSTHPNYAAAANEGQSIAAGKASPSGHMSISRSGFGSSSGLHVSS